MPDLRSLSSKVLPGLIITGGSHRVDALGRASFVGAVNNDRILSIGSGGGDVHPGTATSLYGLVMNHAVPATTTAMSMAAYLGIRTVAASFSLAESRCLYIDVPATGAGSSIGTNHGVYIANQGNAQITNAYGLVIASQSGSSINVACRIDGGALYTLWLKTDVGNVTGGIVFGDSPDTGLYRIGSGVLQVLNMLDAITGFRINGGPVIKAGTGSPEGVLTAPIGSLWQRTDGSTDTAVYRKETGAGNTGWLPITTGGGGGAQSYAPGGGTTRTYTSVATSGNFFLNSLSWAQVDGFSWTYPNVSVGDWVTIELDALVGAEAPEAYLDVVSVVSGSSVWGWGCDGGATRGGVLGWNARPSVYTGLAGGVSKQMTSGDLVGGVLTVRLMYRTTTAANKTMLCSTDFPLRLSAHIFSASSPKNYATRLYAKANFR